MNTKYRIIRIIQIIRIIHNTGTPPRVLCNPRIDDDGAGSPAAGLGPGTAEPDSRELCDRSATTAYQRGAGTAAHLWVGCSACLT